MKVVKKLLESTIILFLVVQDRYKYVFLIYTTIKFF